MSWSANFSGSFHEVIRTLRNFKVEGNPKAAELGHVEIAKEMALCAVDEERGPAARFHVTLSGHTSDEGVYSVLANVSVIGGKK